MPQRQDFPLDRLERVERLLDPEQQFCTLGGLGGGRVFSQEHGGKGVRAGLRKCVAIERDFHAGVAHLGAEVLAVERCESPADVQPQPEQRWQLRVSQIGVQVAGDVDERLLEHIGGVDAGSEPRVDAQLDHATEPIAVAIEYRRQRPAAARAQPLDGVGRVAWSGFHESPHTPYPRAGQKSGQKK